MTCDEFVTLLFAELQALGVGLSYEETSILFRRTWTPVDATESNLTPQEGPLLHAKSWVKCGLVSAMSETEWLISSDPRRMLRHLQYKSLNRELTMFGCACCRRIWDLIPDDRFRWGVEAAERYCDGKISKEAWEAVMDEAGQNFNQLLRAHEATRQPGHPLELASNVAVARFASAATLDLFFEEPGFYSAANVSLQAAYARSRASEGPSFESERAAQAEVLREITGNPFRQCISTNLA